MQFSNLHLPHPLKVIFPHGGHYFLLHWWTYHDRGHVILAKSMRSLTQTAKRAFLENTAGRNQLQLEIKSLSRIEIVSPSLEMCHRATESKRQEVIESFLREVSIRLIPFLDLGLSLPEPFIPCQTWKSQYDPDETPSDCELKEHYSCGNCTHRVALSPMMTPEQFYLKYYEQWQAENSLEIYSGADLEVYSRAERVKDDEEIWAAIPNFGHHAAGADLIKLEKNNFCNVLFYFRRLDELSFSDLKETLDQIQEDNKRKYQQGDELQKKRLDLKRRQEMEKVISFFQKRQ